MITRIRKAVDPNFDADTIEIALSGTSTEIWVYAFLGHDGVPVVQIDTSPGCGRIRINLNDGDVYDNDPDLK